jgi:hypothetical protein
MRILHTIGRLAPEREAQILETARWQAANGCQVVLALPGQATIAGPARDAGLKVEAVELASRFAEREAAYLRAAVRRHCIEVIHVHDEAASLPALLSRDMCPVVRTVDKAEAAKLAETVDMGLPFDHLLVETAGVRDRLVKAERIERAHVTVLTGAPEARMTRLLEAYERAIVRSITGRLIPPRFVGGQPVLRRLAALAAE